jgi:hypothetical protein
MPTVVKLGGRNKKRYFDFGALMIVLFTAELKGWTHNGGNRGIFNKEDSRAFCAALKGSLPEIGESLLDFEEDDDHWICNDCYFNHFVKMHQVDLIKGFLRFCRAEPFRINFEN